MSAVLSTPALAASRLSVISCGKCGVSRPAGHLHCFACGARLDGRVSGAGKLGSVRQRASALFATVRRGSGATIRRLLVRMPKAPRSPRQGSLTKTYAPPVFRRRTWGDRIARGYVYASFAAVSLWFVAGSNGAVPVAAGAPVTEACAWVDTQRLHILAEAGRAADTHRPGIAQRLVELAGLVGSRTAAG